MYWRAFPPDQTIEINTPLGSLMDETVIPRFNSLHSFLGVGSAILSLPSNLRQNSLSEEYLGIGPRLSRFIPPLVGRTDRLGGIGSTTQWITDFAQMQPTPFMGWIARLVCAASAR